MKTINVTFDDKEYKELKQRKGKLSWHDFIIKNNLKKQKLNKGKPT